MSSHPADGEQNVVIALSTGGATVGEDIEWPTFEGQPAPVSIRLNAGQMSATFEVPILNDNAFEVRALRKPLAY